MPAKTETLSALTAKFASLSTSEFRGDSRVVVPEDSLLAVMQHLKDEGRFDLLVDVTCVDYLNYRDARDRFGLVYLLANTITNERLTVRCFLNEPDLTVPSMVPLWSGANWLPPTGHLEVRSSHGLAMDWEVKAVGPRQQHHLRENQGQRSAWQSNRDGRFDRYRPSVVRHRRLQGVR